MSVQRKFMLTLTGLVLLAMLGSIVRDSFTKYQEIENSVNTDKDRLNREITNILTITDSLLSQQVQSSMKLFRQRICRIRALYRRGKPYLLAHNRYRICCWGNEGQGNSYQLVDDLTSYYGRHRYTSSAALAMILSGSPPTSVTDTGRATGIYWHLQGQLWRLSVKAKLFVAVDILGNPFVTGYEPLVNAQGEVVGIGYVG